MIHQRKGTGVRECHELLNFYFWATKWSAIFGDVLAQCLCSFSICNWWINWLIVSICNWWSRRNIRAKGFANIPTLWLVCWKILKEKKHFECNNMQREWTCSAWLRTTGRRPLNFFPTIRWMLCLSSQRAVAQDHENWEYFHCLPANCWAEDRNW